MSKIASSLIFLLIGVSGCAPYTKVVTDEFANHTVYSCTPSGYFGKDTCEKVIEMPCGAHKK